jgi:hypothetical protein
MKKRGAKSSPFSYPVKRCANQSQLPPQLPQPSAFLRFDSMEYPDPRGVSTKSTLMGFTSSKSSFSIMKVSPFWLKISSPSRDSSRAMPREGPAQPPSLRKILTRAFSLRSLKNAIIISSALGVISNIQISSGEINILNNLHTISALSNPIF